MFLDDCRSSVYGSLFEVDEKLSPIRFSPSFQIQNKKLTTTGKSYGLILSIEGSRDSSWIQLLNGLLVKIIIGRMTPELIKAMSALNGLEAIWLCQTHVSDYLLDVIKTLTPVHVLGLENCSIDEHMLLRAAELVNIRDLSINCLCSDVPTIETCALERTVRNSSALALNPIERMTSLESFALHMTSLETPYLEHSAIPSSVSSLSLSFLDCESNFLKKSLTFNLKSLDLTGCKASNFISAVVLNHCTNLESMLIGDSKVFAEWENYDGSLGRLTALNLGGLQLSASDLRWMWDSLKIEKLDLSRNKLDAGFCERLSCFRSLQELNLDCLNLVSIPGNVNPTIKRLSLSRNKLADADLQVLKRYNQLVSLDLSFCGLEALPPVQFCRNLSELSLNASDLTQCDFDTLFELPGLKALNLGSCGIDGGTIDSLSKLVNLYSLSLFDNALDCSSLVELTKLEQLEELDLSDNLNLTGNVVEHLPSRVRTLNLSSTGVQDEELILLLRLLELDFLDLSNTSITDKGLEVLMTHPTLRQLAIEGTKITQKARTILTRSKSLQTVRVCRTALD